MLTLQDIQMLRDFSGRGLPVLSVYLSVDPGPTAARSLPARLKDLVAPIKEQAARLPREAARSLTDDIETVLGMDHVIAGNGSGFGVFACSGRGLLETVAFPMRVRSRAVVDETPYLRPIDAMLAEIQRYCAVVLDRRRADIFRFEMNELSSWEQLAPEEIRKDNYGGFAGYAERRVRSHAEEVAQRHYRDVAARLHQLVGEREGFDKLIVGGHRDSVDGLVTELPPHIAGLLAGTFNIDVHTMTPAIVRAHCVDVAAASDREDEAQIVDEIIETTFAGGAAVLGIPRTVHAANLHAVDLLAVDTEFSEPGEVCRACGWLVADHADVCPACGGEVAVVPDIIDALAAAVRAAGGRVRHVQAKTPLAEHRVGARLRFVPGDGV